MAALSSITAALAQYNANSPWNTSQATAQLALQAIQYLLVNRAQRSGDRGSDLDYESLAGEKTAIEKFLGSTVPRSFGRSRVNRAAFAGRRSIQ